jgi:phosphatidylserine/phosphatidylglycerophosphate/cardiolipin synthase-like enzyme
MTSGPRRRRLWRNVVLLVFLVAWGGMAYWHTHKPLPPGTHVAAPWSAVPAGDITFIADITTADAYGRPILSQAIFDEVLRIVRSAQQLLVLDYFLFNSHRGTDAAGTPSRELSRELRDALLERLRVQPDIRVLFVTDPVNDIYGGEPSADLALLRAGGVQVVVTDLGALRDSNFLYSGLWRLGIGWWTGDGRGNGWLPNPLNSAGEPITLRAFANLVNFKANHRKVIVADDGSGGLVGLVTSGNPHDASSAHSNVALRISGAALHPLIESEISIARNAGWAGELPIPSSPQLSGSGATELAPVSDATAHVRVLTEGAIREAVVERIEAAGNGDSIDVAMFYISDRGVVEALLGASRRGAAVRLILDPNKDAFGREKSGIPNRPVASELVAASDGAVRVRWYRTHGEQFHSKLMMIYGRDRLWLTLGSANFTRRNLEDYNLEANLAVEVTRNSALALQVLEYFETLWENRAPLGIEYTADFGVYADPAQTRYWLYRVMEATGLSTF